MLLLFLLSAYHARGQEEEGEEGEGGEAGEEGDSENARMAKSVEVRGSLPFFTLESSNFCSDFGDEKQIYTKFK